MSRFPCPTYFFPFSVRYGSRFRFRRNLRRYRYVFPCLNGSLGCLVPVWRFPRRLPRSLFHAIKLIIRGWITFIAWKPTFQSSLPLSLMRLRPGLLLDGENAPFSLNLRPSSNFPPKTKKEIFGPARDESGSSDPSVRTA